MEHAHPRKPWPTIRSAAAVDAEVVTRIYIDSWNAGFGELIEQSNRIVTSELVERWRGDLAKSAPHRWWVAEHTGKVVGFVGIGPSRAFNWQRQLSFPMPMWAIWIRVQNWRVHLDAIWLQR